MPKLLAHGCLLALLVVSASMPAAGQATDAATLYELGGTPRSTTEVATRSAVFSASPEALAGSMLRTPLFDGESAIYVLTHQEIRSADDLVWRGLLSEGDGQATLTLKNGYVLGLLYRDQEVYELAVEGGEQVLRKLDQDRYPGCANDSQADPDRALPPMPSAEQLQQRLAARGAGRGVVSRVDLMTLYTPQAQSAAGGQAAIEATVQSAVDISNTAALNSEAAIDFQLVHTGLVNYNDSGNTFIDRNWLQADPTVNALRDEHGADLVGLLVQDGGGFCGVAFLMGNEDPTAFAPFGYQVTARACAVGNLTFTHEHGHNLGLQHNPENGAPPLNATYPFSYGHYVNGSYRTVLSYSNPCINGCTRHPYFSNPDVTFLSNATGIVDQRHNQRTIGLIAPFTAQYRDNESLFGDGFESGDVTVWSTSFP